MSWRARDWAESLSLELLASPVDRHVLLILAGHANEQGENAWPAVSTIRTKTGYAESRIRKALRNLRDVGLIQATGTGPKNVVVYRLAMSRPLSVEEGNRTNDNVGRSSNGRGFLDDAVKDGLGLPRRGLPRRGVAR